MSNNKPSSTTATTTNTSTTTSNDSKKSTTTKTIGLLTKEEKQSFEELIDFCSHANEQVRITALSNLLKFLRIEEYLNNLRYTIRLLEKCIKTLVNLTSDLSHFVSKLSISCLILLSQDESTIFFNEMVKNDLIQNLMNIFIKMERKESNNELNQNDKDTLECILLLLSNLTSNSEQARLKFLNMKTIEETLKKLKKANLKSDDSDTDSDDDDSDSDSDDDSDELKEYNIMKLINYYNRPMNELKISVISSHLIPTILDQVIQAVQTRNLVKPGTLIKIDENGQMINLNTFNEENNNNNIGNTNNNNTVDDSEKNFDDLD